MYRTVLKGLILCRSKNEACGSFKTGGFAQELAFPLDLKRRHWAWPLLVSPLPSLPLVSVRVSQLFALNFLGISQGKGREEREGSEMKCKGRKSL